MDRQQVRCLTTMKTVLVALALLATLCQGRDLIASHIVNGEVVIPHSHPHQVALQIGPRRTHFCGGSLISDEWVVTAAHCVWPMDFIYVVAGAHNISMKEESQQLVEVEKIIRHPEYRPNNRETKKGDIALLKLKTPVHVDGKTVKPIRLPKISDKKNSFWFREATVTGWGKTKYFSLEGSSVLRAVPQRVMTNAACRAAMFFEFVEDTHICTHGIRLKGTCQGDSGGPLIVQEEDKKNTLIGIASFGFTLCDSYWPSVFVRVSSYLDWIYKETGISVRE